MAASFDQSYTVFYANSGIYKNKGTSIWDFFSKLWTFKIPPRQIDRRACYQLSLTKVDPQSVINWTVVGQLSWQYLRPPTLDHCSLYKSLFSENSVATQKHNSASINTNKIQYRMQVYRRDRQALSTARFCRAGQLATADSCSVWPAACSTCMWPPHWRPAGRREMLSGRVVCVGRNPGGGRYRRRSRRVLRRSAARLCRRLHETVPPPPRDSLPATTSLAVLRELN